jgi:hypothetical protein
VVADSGSSGGVEDKDEDDGRTKIGPLPVKLWDASMPHYVKKKYSLNAGVWEML